jgi:hypothetical protein
LWTFSYTTDTLYAPRKYCRAKKSLFELGAIMFIVRSAKVALQVLLQKGKAVGVNSANVLATSEARSKNCTGGTSGDAG